MHAPSRHRDHHLDRPADSEVLGVYDSIDDAAWAAGVLTHHGIGVHGISLVEPAAGVPTRRGGRAPVAQRQTIAILTQLVHASGLLFGWADQEADAERARTPGGRAVMAVLHGTPDDADLAQRILADHAARAGRV